MGASGAVFGCLAAFGYLFPNSLIYLYFLFPIKAKWFVLFYAAVELWSAFQNSAGDNVEVVMLDNVSLPVRPIDTKI